MQFEYKGSKTLFDAISILNDIERNDFIQWARSTSLTKEFSRHVIYGQPYYFVKQVVGRRPNDIECFDPKHRDTIHTFLSQSTDETDIRKVINDILILTIPAPQSPKERIFLFLPAALISEFCTQANRHEHLTASELTTLLQLLAGMQLREAAACDGVGYEAKRNHVKSVLSKTGYSRQMDLVSDLLSQILLEILSQERQQTDQYSIATYARRFLPSDFALHKIVGDDGITRSVLEVGPKNGQPVIVIHGTFFGHISPSFADHLYTNNLRLLIPIRMGFFDETAELMPFEAYRKAIRLSIMAAYSLASHTSISLLSVSNGTSFAMDFALNYPDHVNHMFIFSAEIEGYKNNKTAPKFYNALTRLALEYPMGLRLAIRYSQKKLSNIEGVTKVLSGIFGDNAKDRDIIKQGFGAPHFGEHFIDWFKYSSIGFLQDYRNRAEIDWTLLQNIKAPVHLIHGTEDPLCRIDVLREFSETLVNPSLFEIKGMGHLMDDADRSQAMQYVAQSLET